MTSVMTLKSLAYTTARLEVSNIQSSLLLEATKFDVASQVVSLFTPAVVQSLPPYFHGINTQKEAENWLDKMLSESHLLTIKLKGSDPIIGFVFLYQSDNASAHLGYLLSEKHWKKGYGSELLSGLLDCCRTNQLVKKLIGGVDIDNIASANLLEKIGFIANPEQNNGITFYEYEFPLSKRL